MAKKDKITIPIVVEPDLSTNYDKSQQEIVRYGRDVTKAINEEYQSVVLDAVNKTSKKLNTATKRENFKGLVDFNNWNDTNPVMTSLQKKNYQTLSRKKTRTQQEEKRFQNLSALKKQEDEYIKKLSQFANKTNVQQIIKGLRARADQLDELFVQTLSYAEQVKKQYPNIHGQGMENASKTIKSGKKPKLGKTQQKEVDRAVSMKYNALIEKMGGEDSVSLEEKNEIKAAVEAEVLRQFQKGSKRVAVGGRIQTKLEASEGKAKDPSKGVLTTRTYDSFVADGKFIPSSYVDDKGERRFYQTVGVKDERLSKVFTTTGNKNLNNASFTTLAKEYDEIMGMTNPSEYLLQTAHLLEDVLKDAFENTEDAEIIELFRQKILRLKKMTADEILDADILAYERGENPSDTSYDKESPFYEYARNLPKMGQNVGIRPAEIGSNSWREESHDDSAQSDPRRIAKEELSQLREELRQISIAIPQLKAVLDWLTGISTTAEGSFSSFLENSPDDAFQVVKDVLAEMYEFFGEGKANSGKRNVIDGDKGTDALDNAYELDRPLGSDTETTFADLIDSKTRQVIHSVLDENEEDIPRDLKSELRKTEGTRDEKDETFSKLSELITHMSKVFADAGHADKAKELSKMIEPKYETDPSKLYNTIANFLLYAEQVDISLAKKAAKINEVAGAEVVSKSDMYRDFASNSPEDAERYEQSKRARQRFENAGGLDNLDEALEAFFDSEDSFVKWRADRYNEMAEHYTQYIDGKGEPRQETGQEFIKRNLLYRLDTEGKYPNPDAISGGRHYKRERIKGENIEAYEEKRPNLSYAMRTGLKYKGGYTGAAYGGQTLDERLEKAEQQLAAKKDELEKAEGKEVEVLEAYIKVIENDITVLKQAKEKQERKTKTTEENSKKENAQTGFERDSAWRKKKEVEKQQAELQESLKNGYEVGGTFKHKTKGEGIIKSINENGTMEVKWLNEEPKMKDGEEVFPKVLTKGFEKFLLSYTAPILDAVEEKGVEDKKQEQVQVPQKETISEIDEKQLSSTNGINITGNPVNVYTQGGVLNVDGELTNVETVDVALISKGTATINLGEGAVVKGALGANNANQGTPIGTNIESKLKGVEVFKPNYNDATHTYTNEKGEKIFSITQIRDILLGRNNPAFKADLDNMRASALAGEQTAQTMNMAQKDFNFMSDIVGKGAFGNAFHLAVEKLIANGANEGVTTLDQLKEVNIKAYNDVVTEWETAQTILANLGKDLSHFDLEKELPGYWETIKQSKMTPTQFQEQVVGMRMHGNRGSYEVGLQPDQAYLMGKGLSFVDNKTGNPAHAGLQLTAAAMVGKYAKNAIDDIENLDEIKPAAEEFIKTFIMSVKDNVVELIEYALMNENDVYGDIADAYEIAKTGIRRKTPQEYEKQMDTRMKTGVISTDLGVVESADATLGGGHLYSSPRDEKGAIREYINSYKKITKIEREINQLEEELKKAVDNNGTDSEDIHARLAARKQALIDYKENAPEFKQESDGSARIGDLLLSEDGLKELEKQRIEADDLNAIKKEDTNAKTNSKERASRHKENLSYVEKYLALQKELLEVQNEEYKLELKIQALEAKGDKSSPDRTQAEENKKANEELRESLEKEIGEYGYKANYGRFSGKGVVLSEDENSELQDRLVFAQKEADKKKRKIAQNSAESLVKIEQNLSQRLLKAVRDRNEANLNIEKQKTAVLKDANLENASTISALEDKAKSAEKEIVSLNEEAEKLGITLTSQSYGIEQSNLGFKADVEKEKASRGRQSANSSEKERVKQSKQVSNEYIKNLEQQGLIEVKIAKLQKDMANQSGDKLKDSKAYLTLLNEQQASLRANLPILDLQEKTLNGIQLTDEQILDLRQRQTQVESQSALKMSKMEAEYKPQVSLLDQLIGGFKQTFENVTMYSMASRVFQELEQGVRQLFESVRELDAALVDIQIASGMTREETHLMMLEYNKLGNELGKTTQEIAMASNDWLRAGYQGQEAMELTRASAQLATLGMIDTADATSYLISTMKGWKMEAEDVSRVVDKLTAVDIQTYLFMET